MATLVLEDGTGLDNANAYADQTFAVTVFPTFLTNLANWNPASSDERDDALIAGTLYMDLVYTWLGEQANPTVQALDFPRIGIRCDHILVDPFPVEIQQAASLLAVLHLDQIAGTNSQGIFGEAIIGSITTGSVRKKSITIGSGIRWQRDYGTSLVSKAAVEKLIPVLGRLINCFLQDRGRVGAGRLARM